MRSIETGIDIAAPGGRVWSILTDFGRHPDWNPFILAIEGEPVAGAWLTVRLQPPGGRAMTFRPRVLAATPGRELRWQGHLLIPGLFDGEHVFRIEPAGAGCRFRQAETFRGILPPLMSRTLEATRRGFEAMNAALKAEAERSGPV